jgi:hypothetical protein
MASTLQRVLDLWRESERQLAVYGENSVEGRALASQIARLRRLYQTITAHETRDAQEFRAADRTIVQSESLAMRAVAGTAHAAEALERSRAARKRGFTVLPGDGKAAAQGEPEAAPTRR